MLDPSIALDARTPAPQSGIDATGQLVNLSNLVNQGQVQQAQLTGLNQENQQRDIQMQQMRTLNEAYKGSLNPDGTIDTGKLSSALAAGGAGSRIPDVLKGVTEFQQSLATLKKSQADAADAQADALGTFGKGLQTANYDPQLFLTKAQSAISQKAVDPQQIGPAIQQVQQALLQDPTGTSARVVVKQFADGAVKSSQLWTDRQAQQDQATARMTQANAAATNAQRQNDQQNLKDWSAKLGSTTNGQDYTSVLNQMPHGLAVQFPSAGSWTPDTSKAALRVGMTPAEISADNRNTQGEKERVAHDQAIESTEQQNATTNASRLTWEQNNGTTPGQAGAQARFQQTEIDKARKQLNEIHTQRTALGGALAVENGQPFQYTDPSSNKVVKGTMDDETRTTLQQQYNNVTTQGQRIVQKYGGQASNNQIQANELPQPQGQQPPAPAPQQQTQQPTPARQPQQQPANQPPAQAVAQMPVGKAVTFANGQKWMKDAQGRLTQLQ